MTEIDVRHKGNPTGKVVPLIIGRHQDAKTRTGDQEQRAEPEPAGIDYLKIPDHAYGQDLQAQINYIRGLNRATNASAGLDQPAVAYGILGALAMAADCAICGPYPCTPPAPGRSRRYHDRLPRRARSRPADGRGTARAPTGPGPPGRLFLAGQDNPVWARHRHAFFMPDPASAPHAAMARAVRRR